MCVCLFLNGDRKIGFINAFGQSNFFLHSMHPIRLDEMTIEHAASERASERPRSNHMCTNLSRDVYTREA